MQHQPVIVSTPGHYFVIDGYDPNTGAYHVGQSGKVYRGGSDWMTPSQIQGLAGAPSGALYTVHPLAGQQAQVLPPLGAPAGQRQVLPPLPVASTQREVLPPLDLGNTPPPPPIPSSPVAPTDEPPDLAPTATGDTIVAADPPTIAPIAVHDVPPPTPASVDLPGGPVPVPIRDVPPPSLASTEPAPNAVDNVPPPTLAASEPTSSATSDAAPLAPPDDATIAQPSPGPADIARPPLAVSPGMAIGAVAVGSSRQPPPPPPPPRRRPEDDDELLPNG
jgi:hypothetical protein